MCVTTPIASLLAVVVWRLVHGPIIALLGRDEPFYWDGGARMMDAREGSQDATLNEKSPSRMQETPCLVQSSQLV